MPILEIRRHAERAGDPARDRLEPLARAADERGRETALAQEPRRSRTDPGARSRDDRNPFLHDRMIAR